MGNRVSVMFTLPSSLRCRVDRCVYSLPSGVGGGQCGGEVSFEREMIWSSSADAVTRSEKKKTIITAVSLPPLCAVMHGVFEQI